LLELGGQRQQPGLAAGGCGDLHCGWQPILVEAGRHRRGGLPEEFQTAV
jgi:hypothetical protein